MLFSRFVASIDYYGLSLGVDILPGSVFLNMFLSGLIEMPCYVLACVALNKVKQVRETSCRNISLVLWCLWTGFTTKQILLELKRVILAPQIGRKWPTSATLMLSGICCILMAPFIANQGKNTGPKTYSDCVNLECVSPQKAASFIWNLSFNASCAIIFCGFHSSALQLRLQICSIWLRYSHCWASSSARRRFLLCTCSQRNSSPR